MAWFLLTTATSGVLPGRPHDLSLLWSLRGGAQVTVPAVALHSIGTATASARWQWAAPPREDTREDAGMYVRPMGIDRSAAAAPKALRVPDALLCAMAEEARLMGLSESEIWAEAAREWLSHRRHNDDPEPPAPAAALKRPRPSRSWDGIDTLMNDLRQVGVSPDEAA